MPYTKFNVLKDTWRTQESTDYGRESGGHRKRGEKWRGLVTFGSRFDHNEVRSGHFSNMIDTLPMVKYIFRCLSAVLVG